MARIGLALDDVRAGRLPDVCIVCGQPAEFHISQRLIWRPQSISLLLWLTTCLCPPLILVAMIVSLIDARSVRAEWPLCRRHRGYWTRHGFLVYGPLWAIALVALTLALLLLNQSLPSNAFLILVLGTGSALLVWAVFVAFVRHFSIRIVQFTNHHLILAQVSEQFARAVQLEKSPEGEISRSDWPRYDPYPREAPAGESANQPQSIDKRRPPSDGSLRGFPRRNRGANS